MKKVYVVSVRQLTFKRDSAFTKNDIKRYRKLLGEISCLPSSTIVEVFASLELAKQNARKLNKSSYTGYRYLPFTDCNGNVYHSTLTVYDYYVEEQNLVD